MELARVGAGVSGTKAASMLELHPPNLDFVSLAASMGVPASRARSAEELHSLLGQALATPGPYLVEAVLA